MIKNNIFILCIVMQYISWYYSSSMRFSLLIAWILIYNLITYKELLLKAIALLMCLAIVMHDFIIPIIYIKYPILAYYIILLCLLLFISSLVSLWTNRYHMIVSSVYTETDAFVANKYPKDLQGLILALILAPFGSYSIIVKGQQYLFRKGKVIKRPFTNYQEYFLRQITMPEISRLNRLIGKRWTLTNNCLSVFKQFLS